MLLTYRNVRDILEAEIMLALCGASNITKDFNMECYLRFKIYIWPYLLQNVTTNKYCEVELGL